LQAALKFDRLRVVLVSTRNPLNIGAAARAMSNFGFLRLRVVNPFEAAFREARSAVGASELLARAEVFPSVAKAVADCTLVVGTTSVGSREVRHPVRRLEDGAKLIRKRLRSSRVALLFGSERVGLSNEELSYCHWLMRIPTREVHRSVNLGQAVAICLYELVRKSKLPRLTEKKKLATAGEIDRVYTVLLDALRESGYLEPRTAALTQEKTRRLLHRLQLSASDAEAWLGMLRQILWKLHSENDPR
jgi:TrmH family RNA methyltransferase